jgi:hypothetical protein
MTDSSAPSTPCPVCSKLDPSSAPERVCPACGRDLVDPLRLIEDALRRDAAAGQDWLIDPE